MSACQASCKQPVNCPICGSKPSKYATDSINLDFLPKYTKIELIDDYQIKEDI